MAGKGFCVKIRLELHAITCPGVWLCPNGKVALRITSFGSTLESHRVSPIFPLLFHNEFNFKKTFTRLAALTELQRNLERQSLYAELIQWLSPCNQPVLLATFQTNLTDLLYPVTQCRRLLPGVDVDLLMDPSKYFPGIIAPKIEISTNTVIEEVLTIYDANLDRPYVVNPKTIDSKQKCYAHRKRPVKGIIRQRKVCHNRAKAKPQISSSTRCCNDVEYSYQDGLARTSQPMKHDICIDDTELDPPSRYRRVPSVCGNLHIFDSCPVCFKYKCYFSSKCDKLLENSANSRARLQKDDSAPRQPTSTGIRSSVLVPERVANKTHSSYRPLT
ncbi:spermatogenesis-associated protein 6 isoform X1 [Frieseomelitta varia]|uniref:spermatogenesis-associated protein 6 isoform X1 n=1 Tax=Frieseomelitta varia TaxID=561572 RepID=UPI001CB697BC|nr:spermatogenesis-associated protein 6 isoform X1 [Frieseomelitta varia]